MADITVYKRDDAVIYVKVTQDGEVFDITGCSAKLTVKTNETDLDAAAKFQATATLYSIPGGKLKFVLTTTNTDQTPGTYFYDVQLKTSDTKIYTIAKGYFVILQDITIGTA